MSFRKNRLIAAVERAIADLRDAVEALVHDEYDEASEKFRSARDTINEQADQLLPAERPEPPARPEDDADDSDITGG